MGTGRDIYTRNNTYNGEENTIYSEPAYKGSVVRSSGQKMADLSVCIVLRVCIVLSGSIVMRQLTVVGTDQHSLKLSV